MIGCEKDYLDQPKPTESVNTSVIFESSDGVEAFMSGILRVSRSQFERTDAGGLYSMYFARVVKGNDLILGYQWYVFDYENDNREPTYTRTIFSWEFPIFHDQSTESLYRRCEKKHQFVPTRKR